MWGNKQMNTITRHNKVIRDATSDLLIRVKPGDIRGAMCRDHQKCVVAKAIMRQKKSTTKWVDVGNRIVLVGTGKRTGLRYKLDNQSANQIRFFDENDGRFAPCTVLLSAPSKPGGKYRSLGSRKGDGSSGGHSRKPRREPTR